MGHAVFGNYDRAALDREYDNRAKVTDADSYSERFGQLSIRARATLPARLDVAYGPSPAERLDVFTVPGAARAPVNVFYHGGYWKARDKADFDFVALGLQPSGVVTVVVNYALIPAVGMDELVRQCRAALAWVWLNAARWGADRDHLYVSGHSAGGHLVAMLMATDWVAFDSALPVDPIKGGCGISGLYDLEPIRLCFLNDDLHLSEREAARNSPVRLERRSRGALLLPVGALEGPEYLRQTQDLARSWAATTPAPEVMVMPDVDHFSIVAQLADPASSLSSAIQRQMGV